MLVSLRISNFILIEECRIEWHSRFNALTGETGAGKSVVISALSLLLGERASSESVRDAKQESVIEAEFELPPNHALTQSICANLEQCGVSIEENRVLISRRFSSNGRSRTFINNSSCLLKTLQEIGERLVDLHGQHEHQSLLRKAAYLPLLDQCGDLAARVQTYQEAYQQWQEAQRALHELEANERERKQREDMLRYQRDEIDAAELQPGEDAEIDSRLNVIQFAEKLSERCQTMIQSLSEGDEGREPLLDELDRLEAALNEMQSLDQQVKTISDVWQSAVISLREVSREIERYASGLEFDPNELDRLQERRYVLKELKGKYGETIEDILAYRERIHEELDRIEHADEEREQLTLAVNEKQKTVASLGAQLHKQRTKTAKAVTKSVQNELAALGMKNAKFQIDANYRFSPDGIDAGEKQPVLFGPNGGDEIDFLITTIPGKPLRPLRDVASGGEISRIMLALKCAFGEADPVPLMVFDEIDAGVGGETAEAVADRLSKLAQCKQIICITHLPQIASKADRNLRVEKSESEGNLQSQVVALEGKAREKELARMLGAQDSTASQRYARELLQNNKH
ncbi:MAG: DNA repair protein RecN [Candidatus Hinthialibacter antarcticus]|nr:DNA repair protein RecN [Candidatus Hinthialibacter antarcticus]